MSDEASGKNTEAQVASLFARYEPAMVKLGKALRAKLQRRLPGLNEIVYLYENQHSLVIAYSPSAGGGGSDAICGMALYPDRAKLFFNHAAQLTKADPQKLLEGSGKMVRYVALEAAADLDRPEIEALLAAAVKLAKLRLDPRAKGAVVLKAEEQKQRALRAKQTKARR